MATVALSTLRSELQTMLKDVEAKKWSTDDLDIFINLAIAQWTTDMPIASAYDYTVVSGQHEYDLPENAVAVTRVRGYFETSTSLEFINPVDVGPGVWTDNAEPRGYIVGFPTETNIYFPRVPQGSSFTLYYGATHNPLDTDTATLNLHMKRWGELAVLYYSAHLAFLPYASNRARLEQWARKQDLNVNNPLEEESEKYLKLYEDLLDKHGGPGTWTFIERNLV